jgi:hypothetical protein
MRLIGPGRVFPICPLESAARDGADFIRRKALRFSALRVLLRERDDRAAPHDPRKGSAGDSRNPDRPCPL